MDHCEMTVEQFLDVIECKQRIIIRSYNAIDGGDRYDVKFDGTISDDGSYKALRKFTSMSVRNVFFEPQDATVVVIIR